MNREWQEKQEKIRGEFEPICFILQADEPEFGCEARSETEPVFGRLLLLTPEGRKTVAIEESRLMQSGFYDRMWVGYLAGKPVLVEKQNTQAAREEDLIWLRQQMLL